MIATGTDVKPLECLLFMRDVRSRNYFEQMKGRGTRTLGHDDLRKVTPSALTAKTHYVIVDAVGVTKSLKTASRPLITQPSVPLKDLAMGVMMGARDEDTVASLAGRLARLDRQLDHSEKERIKVKAGGAELTQIVGDLLAALDPDRIDEKAREIEPVSEGAKPSPVAYDKAREELVGDAAAVFNGELIELIDSIRRDKEQTIDHESLDKVLRAEWEGDAQENAKAMAPGLPELPGSPPRRDRSAHDLLRRTASPPGGDLRHDPGSVRTGSRATGPCCPPCGCGRHTPCWMSTRAANRPAS